MSAQHHRIAPPLRRSPFADAWGALAPECEELCGMPVPARFHRTSLPPVALADCSFLPRAGIKGAEAAAWLQAHGIPTPPRHNQWLAHRGGLVARLGHSEFLVEAADADDWTRPLRGDGAWSERAMPVPRQDAGLLLCGGQVHDLLAQVCSIDFRAAATMPQALTMTLMLGVPVLAIALPGAAVPAWRLWCDPSFAALLWRTLAQIAGELGGGPLGWRQLGELGIPCRWSAPAERAPDPSPQSSTQP